MELEVHVHNDICARDYEYDPALCAANKLEYILSVAMQWVQHGKLELRSGGGAAAGPQQDDHDDDEEEDVENSSGVDQHEDGDQGEMKPSAPSTKTKTTEMPVSATPTTLSAASSPSHSLRGRTGQPKVDEVEEVEQDMAASMMSPHPSSGRGLPGMRKMHRQVNKRVPVTMSDLATLFTLLKDSDQDLKSLFAPTRYSYDDLNSLEALIQFARGAAVSALDELLQFFTLLTDPGYQAALFPMVSITLPRKQRAKGSKERGGKKLLSRRSTVLVDRAFRYLGLLELMKKRGQFKETLSPAAVAASGTSFRHAASANSVLADLNKQLVAQVLHHTAKEHWLDQALPAPALTDKRSTESGGAAAASSTKEDAQAVRKKIAEETANVAQRNRTLELLWQLSQFWSLREVLALVNTFKIKKVSVFQAEDILKLFRDYQITDAWEPVADRTKAAAGGRIYFELMAPRLRSRDEREKERLKQAVKALERHGRVTEFLTRRKPEEWYAALHAEFVSILFPGSSVLTDVQVANHVQSQALLMASGKRKRPAEILGNATELLVNEAKRVRDFRERTAGGTGKRLSDAWTAKDYTNWAQQVSGGFLVLAQTDSAKETQSGASSGGARDENKDGAGHRHEDDEHEGVRQAERRRSNTKVSRVEMLAVVARGYKLKCTHYPRDTQLFAVLAQLDADEAAPSPDVKTGRLGQVPTGEGKTTIVAILAIILALQGKKVDVITSSSELAKPQEEELRPLYAMFGLKSDVVAEKETNFAGSHIIYGAAADFQWADLRYRFQGEALERNEATRPYQVAIVDETDALMVDSKDAQALMSAPLPGYHHLQIWFTFAWTQMNTAKQLLRQFLVPVSTSGSSGGGEDGQDEEGGTNKNDTSGTESTSSLKKRWLTFIMPDENFPKCRTYEQFQATWLEIYKAPITAANSLEMKRDKESGALEYGSWTAFVIQFVEEQLRIAARDFEYRENSNLRKKKVELSEKQRKEMKKLDERKDEHGTAITDEELAGLKMKKFPKLHYMPHMYDFIVSTYNDGVRQFLELKHGLRMTPLAMTTNFLSNVHFFKKYARIFGLTGTLGDVETQGLMEDTYGLDFFFIPGHKSKQFYELRPLIVYPAEASGTQQQNSKHIWAWAETVVSVNLAHAALGRAVLVICESIYMANNMFQEFETHLASLRNQTSNVGRKRESEWKGGIDSSAATKIQLHKYSTQEERENALGRPAQAGDIIVATNIAGRGTDIKLTKEVERNGGMHVSVTFLPTNARVQEQNFGRTSRAGNRGTAQLIVDGMRLGALSAGAQHPDAVPPPEVSSRVEVKEEEHEVASGAVTVKTAAWQFAPLPVEEDSAEFILANRDAWYRQMIVVDAPGQVRRTLKKDLVFDRFLNLLEELEMRANALKLDRLGSGPEYEALVKLNKRDALEENFSLFVAAAENQFEKMATDKDVIDWFEAKFAKPMRDAVRSGDEFAIVQNPYWLVKAGNYEISRKNYARAQEILLAGFRLAEKTAGLCPEVFYSAGFAHMGEHGKDEGSNEYDTCPMNCFPWAIEIIEDKIFPQLDVTESCTKANGDRDVIQKEVLKKQTDNKREIYHAMIREMKKIIGDPTVAVEERTEQLDKAEKSARAKKEEHEAFIAEAKKYENDDHFMQNWDIAERRQQLNKDKKLLEDVCDGDSDKLKEEKKNFKQQYEHAVEGKLPWAQRMENWELHLHEVKLLCSEKCFTEMFGEERDKGKMQPELEEAAKFGGLVGSFEVELKYNPPIDLAALFTMLFLGLAQIVAGALLTVLSVGAAAQFGQGLLAEGISDLVTCVKDVIINRNFDWASWGISKAVSLAISIVTAGAGAIKEMAKIAAGVVKGSIEITGKVVLESAKMVGIAALKETGKQIGNHLTNAFVTEKATQAIGRAIENSIRKNLETFLAESQDVAALYKADAQNGDRVFSCKLGMTKFGLEFLKSYAHAASKAGFNCVKLGSDLVEAQKAAEEIVALAVQLKPCLQDAARTLAKERDVFTDYARQIYENARKEVDRKRSEAGASCDAGDTSRLKEIFDEAQSIAAERQRDSSKRAGKFAVSGGADQKYVRENLDAVRGCFRGLRQEAIDKAQQNQEQGQEKNQGLGFQGQRAQQKNEKNEGSTQKGTGMLQKRAATPNWNKDATFDADEGPQAMEQVGDVEDPKKVAAQVSQRAAKVMEQAIGSRILGPAVQAAEGIGWQHATQAFDRKVTDKLQNDLQEKNRQSYNNNALGEHGDSTLKSLMDHHNATTNENQAKDILKQWKAQGKKGACIKQAREEVHNNNAACQAGFADQIKGGSEANLASLGLTAQQMGCPVEIRDQNGNYIGTAGRGLPGTP
eukprot:g19694.t1